MLKIQNPRAESWSFKMESADHDGSDGVGVEIDAYRIQSLLDRLGESSIGIMKMNIEGVEKKVFESNVDWLDVTEVLILELHDRHVEGCSEAYRIAVAGRGRKASLAGENIISIRR